MKHDVSEVTGMIQDRGTLAEEKPEAIWQQQWQQHQKRQQQQQPGEELSK